MNARRARLISRTPGRPRQRQGGFLGGLFRLLFGIRKPKPPPPPPATPLPPAPDTSGRKADQLADARDQQLDAHRSRIRRGKGNRGFGMSPFKGLGG